MKRYKFRAWHKKEKRMFEVLGFDIYSVIEAAEDGESRYAEHDREDVILMQYNTLNCAIETLKKFVKRILSKSPHIFKPKDYMKEGKP